MSHVRKDEGSSAALVKVSSGERLGHRGERPACCHFALLQLQESSRPTRNLTDGREISRWWCERLLQSSVAKALERAAQGGGSAQTMVNGGRWQQAAAASGKKERKKRRKKRKGVGWAKEFCYVKKWDAREIFNGLGRALDWVEWVGKQ
jgi:hypothetical protein